MVEQLRNGSNLPLGRMLVRIQHVSLVHERNKTRGVKKINRNSRVTSNGGDSNGIIVRQDSYSLLVFGFTKSIEKVWKPNEKHVTQGRESDQT